MSLIGIFLELDEINPLDEVVLMKKILWFI